MPEINDLILDNSKVSREVFDLFTAPQKLKKIKFENCLFENGAIASLERFKNLNKLTISSCLGMRANEMAKLASLPVDSLNFQNLNITDQEITSLKDWRDLEDLEFQNCKSFYGKSLGLLNRVPVEDLEIKGCPISDTTIADLKSWTCLKELTLWDCKNVTGKTINQLTSSPIEEISIKRCGITSDFFKQLPSLFYLEELQVESCLGLKGNFISNPEFRSLRELSLVDIPLERVDVIAIASMKELRNLEFFRTGNHKDSDDPDPVSSPEFDKKNNERLKYPPYFLRDLSKNAGLEKLAIDFDRLESGSFKDLNQFKGLVELAIYAENPIPGEVMDQIASFSIKTLNLYGPCIDNSDWYRFKGSRNIESLYINNNELDDKDLEAISLLDLETLSIKGGLVTDKGLMKITKMKSLKHFNFTDLENTTLKGRFLVGRRMPDCQINQNGLNKRRKHKRNLKK